MTRTPCDARAANERDTGVIFCAAIGAQSGRVFGNVSMSPDFRIAMLLLGAVLLLAAVFAGQILRDTLRPRVRTLARVVLGVAGASLIAWILASQLAARPQPVPTPVLAPPSPDARRVDLIGPASSALADCPVATAPSLPDGASATLKQMMAARAAFSAYDAATNNYTQCVDEMVARVAKQSAGS